MDRYAPLLLVLSLLCGSIGCTDPGKPGGGPLAMDLGGTLDDLANAGADTSALAPPRPPPCLGYILHSTPTGPNEVPLTSLIDMEGRLVRSWPFSGFPSVMLPGGSLLVSRSMRDVDLNLLQDTEELLQVSWDGKALWSFAEWDDDKTGQMMSRQHHDLQRASNPVGYYAPGQSMDPVGVTTVLGHLTRSVPAVSDQRLTDDVIYQVNAVGRVGSFIWQAADHVEAFGFDKSARADIKQNPRYDDERGSGDWLHLNSMSLLGRNPWYDKFGDTRFAPDNILISSREASFLAIISHETGGIVWRLGPDLSAGQPGAGVGQLVGPHHVHMIPAGLPGAGNILVFDNGGISGYGGPGGYPRYTRTYSRVVEIDPRTMNKVWEYGPQSGVKMLFSPALGSAQRLPSGNTFITSGAEGRMLEVTPKGDVVWQHLVRNKQRPVNIYRAYRVPPEWLPAGANIAGYPAWSKACQAR